jgi:hypothetical protein
MEMTYQTFSMSEGKEVETNANKPSTKSVKMSQRSSNQRRSSGQFPIEISTGLLLNKCQNLKTNSDMMKEKMKFLGPEMREKFVQYQDLNFRILSDKMVSYESYFSSRNKHL